MWFRPTTIAGRTTGSASFDRPKSVAGRARFAELSSTCRFLVQCSAESRQFPTIVKALGRRDGDMVCLIVSIELTRIASRQLCPYVLALGPPVERSSHDKRVARSGKPASAADRVHR